MRGRLRNKIIEGFVSARRNTGGGNIVPEDSTVDYLREKAGLWRQCIQKVRDIFLTINGKGLVVSGAAEGDHDRLLRGDVAASHSMERPAAP